METNRLIVEKLRLNPDADPTDGSSNPVESDGVFDALALKADSGAMTTALNLKLNSSTYTAADVLTKLKTVDGTTSGLDADLLDGYEASTTGTMSTVAVRDGSGDITSRLFRPTYAEQTTAPATTADIAFRNDTTDNYIRFMSSDAIKAWLTSIGASGAPMFAIPSENLKGSVANITRSNLSATASCHAPLFISPVTGFIRLRYTVRNTYTSTNWISTTVFSHLGQMLI